MEPKFDSKTYRENLAKDLKEIRKTDPRKAREVLDEEKYHFRYKSAASQRQAEKFEQEAEKPPIPPLSTADTASLSNFPALPSFSASCSNFSA